MSSSGKTPHLTIDALSALGFKLAVYRNWILLGAIRAMQRVLTELKDTGSVAGLRGSVATFAELNDLAGLAEIQALEKRYAAADTFGELGL
jgi:2-methylisocitrate lyase-like PEP mutase family enzyme